MAIVNEVLDERISGVEELALDKVPEVVDNTPEKYRGKSTADIIMMHQEAEKLIGKQGSEVGDLRRVVDDFIKTQSLKQPVQEEPVEEVDFYSNPEAAIKKAIDNHPSVVSAKETSLAMKREALLSKLNTSHPNYLETAQDPAFKAWVDSSRIRTEMLARAETYLDYDAADDLLTNWKERQGVTKNVVDTAKLDRDRSLKAASVTTQGSTEGASKKRYYREDIMKLMTTDPDRYAARSAEIMLAYAENRVI